VRLEPSKTMAIFHLLLKVYDQTFPNSYYHHTISSAKKKGEKKGDKKGTVLFIKPRGKFLKKENK
jgi:hypothetical protein